MNLIERWLSSTECRYKFVIVRLDVDSRVPGGGLAAWRARATSCEHGSKGDVVLLNCGVLKVDPDGEDFVVGGFVAAPRGFASKLDAGDWACGGKDRFEQV